MRVTGVVGVMGAGIETKARIGAGIGGEMEERPGRDAKLFSFQVNTE